MAERLTAKAFHDAGGVDDWRVLFWGAHAFFATESFRQGTEFVAALGVIADELDHHPDVDLRPEGVTVKTFTEINGRMSDKDVDLARRVSALAAEHGLEADPSQLRVVGVAVAQDSGADVRPFWAAVLGYDYLDDTDAIDPARRNPHFMFHELNPPKPGRGRFHIDVSVPADQAQARVDAAIAAGGRLVKDNGPHWWTLASPENHGVDVAAWQDIEDFND